MHDMQLLQKFDSELSEAFLDGLSHSYPQAGQPSQVMTDLTTSTNIIKYQKCIYVGMAHRVKSPKSIDTRSQRSTADTTVAILGDSAIPTSLCFGTCMHVCVLHTLLSISTLRLELAL